MRKEKFNKAIFWDYNVDKMDLNNLDVKLWYLTRKLEFGDFSGITKNDLKKHLGQLNVDQSLKELLQNYLKVNVKNRVN